MARYKNFIFTSESNFLTAKKHLKKDIIPFLGSLEKKGKIILVTETAKSSLLPLLKKLKIAAFFNAIYPGENFTAPQRLHDILNHSGCQPEETLLISDNLRGELKIAKKLGLATVWLSQEKNIIGFVPTIHLKHLNDLLFYLVA